MKANVSWQKHYDMFSEVEYLGEENPGEHYFRITRREVEGFWDAEEDECYALVEDKVVIGFEGYATYPNWEEELAMRKILKELNIILWVPSTPQSLC